MGTAERKMELWRDLQSRVAANPSALVRRSYVGAIDDVNNTDRTVTAKINTGALDRYKTVIDPKGLNLSAYRECPVVLWEHGKDPKRGTMPIGKNLWTKTKNVGNGHIVAMTKFAPDDDSQVIFEQYRDEFLRGWSVNVLPDHKQCSPPTKEEKRRRPELENCEMMYRSGELAEYSGVAVPGNAECLSILESRGIWFPDEARGQLVPAVARDDGDDDESDDDEDDVSRYITHSGDEWIVHAEDGKVLGKHPSKEAAVKQLQAVEAHKHDEGRALPQIVGERYEDIHRSLRQEIDRHYAAQADLVKTFLDLMRGRV